MTPRRSTLLLASGLLACGLLACGAGQPSHADPKQPAPEAALTPAPQPAAVPPTPAEPAPPVDVAGSINAFAVDLHRALASEPGDLFVSPASITFAFAMAHAGARGATQQEIARVFHLGGDADALHRGVASTLAGWSVARDGQELAVANRLYGERSVHFEPAYLDLTGTVFAAPLELVDFKTAAEPARERINTWVAERTHDKIKDLIPGGGLNEGTRLVLVNAVYFKGTWEEAFEPSRTARAPFHAADGDRTVKLMQRTGPQRVAVVADAGLKLLELPYKGGAFSLVVVLPDAVDGLAALEQALTADALAGWIADARERPVAVKLPRFQIEPGDGLHLKDVLSGLGMTTSFTGDADYTGIAPRGEGIFIDDAIHKAFVAVDEVGTEAAAATAVMAKGAGAPAPPLEFTADHPFLFLIRDTGTGAILFMGRLAAPKPA